MAASESILITTPEPHVITDCYALIKVLASKGYAERRLVVNRVESDAEAADISRKMTFASRRFLIPSWTFWDRSPKILRLPGRLDVRSPLMLSEPRSRVAAQGRDCPAVGRRRGSAS